MKRFRYLVSTINRHLYGPRWAKKQARDGVGVRWVCASEPQRRGVIHFHALMAGVGDVRRLGVMDEWYRIAGIARIEEPKQHDAVARYVSKYVVKGGEIDMGGPLVPIDDDQLNLFRPDAGHDSPVIG